MALPAHLRVLVVAHTHWDREWYRPAGVFRQRLVALIDELLEDPPPA
jgi:alpha-mannosidase